MFPEGIILQPHHLAVGVYKYVMVKDKSGALDIRFAEPKVLHKRIVKRVERAVGAGFIGVVEAQTDTTPPVFYVQDATSESLQISSDADADARLIAKLTGMKIVAGKHESADPSDDDTLVLAPNLVRTKRATKPHPAERKATACIDYDEAKSLADAHGLKIEACLEGELLLIPTTGVKLGFQTYRKGWMLYGYAADGSDIVKTLLSIVSRGRVKLEARETEYVPMPTEEGYHAKVTDIINRKRRESAGDE
jgi:hypothetical protein